MKIFFYILFVFSSVILYSTGLKYSFFENNGLLPGKVKYFGKADNLDIFITNKNILFHNYKFYKKNDSIYKEKESIVFDIKGFNLCKNEITNESSKINIFKNNQKNYLRRYDTLLFLGKNKSLSLFFHKNKFRFDTKFEKSAKEKFLEFEIFNKDSIVLNNNSIKIKSDIADLKIDNIKVIQNNNSNIDYKIEKNKNVFKIIPQNYDNDAGLIIDPIFYSTYLGGSDYDIGREIEHDSEGNVIIAGNTTSLDFPVTEDAYSEYFYENEFSYPDIFVSKIDSSGNLIFSTYIGGFGDDYAEALQIVNNDIIVSGYTYSYNTFPVSDSALFTKMIGGYDIFLLKLNSAGDSIKQSTLYGGLQDDIPQDIAISNNRIFLCGYSGKDGNYPYTDNAVQDTNSGKYDIFLTIFDYNLENILYSSLIGGINDDFAQSIKINNDIAYITGITESPDFPINNGTKFNLDSNETKSDAFILKFNFINEEFEKIKYIGGSGHDRAYGLDINDNSVFIAGYTESYDFPVNGNTYDRIYNDGIQISQFGDIFISKFDNDLNPEESTYLGSNATERALAIDIFNDDVYLTGSTNSTHFPVTLSTYDSSYNSKDFTPDGFISRFDNNLNKLKYSTYFGGDSNDIGYDISVHNFIAYVTGRTHSDNFPLSEFAIDSVRTDTNTSDAFVLVIDTEVLNADIPDTLYICSGESKNLNLNITGYKGSYTIDIEPDDFVIFNDDLITFINDTTIKYSITIEDENGQIIQKYMTAKIVQKPQPEIFGHRRIIPDSIYHYFVEYNNLSDYNWEIENGIIISDNDSAHVQVRWSDTIPRELRVYQTALNGCVGYDSVFAVDFIKYRTKINFIEGDTVVCKGNYAILDAGSGFEHYYWNTGTRTRLDTIYSEGDYFAVMEDSLGYGGITDTVSIRFVDAPFVSIEGDTILQIFRNHIFNTDNNPAYFYEWNTEKGEIINGADLSEMTYSTDLIGIDTISVNVNNATDCSGNDTLFVLCGNFLKPVISFNGNSDICDGDSVLADAGYGYLKYFWNNGDTNRINVIREKGNYWVRVVDILGESHYSDTVSIEKFPSPNKPKIALSEDKIRCFSAAFKYEWYLNGNLIPGENERFIIPQNSGYYQVRVVNEFGCGKFSDSLFANANSVNIIEDNNIKIFQNSIIVNNLYDYDFIIYNYLGESLIKGKIKNTEYKINLNDFTNGVYFLTLNKENQIIRKKIFIW